MMIINIIAVGKLKNEFTNAANEYIKRLNVRCKLKITELPEAFLPENPSEKDINRALDTEATTILHAVSGYTVALCVEGKSLSSEEFAQILSDNSGSAGNAGHYTFIIGSSHGLSERVKKAVDLRLSFSKMTFPHGLMRVILLEQIYRAFMINAGAKYHK